MNKTYTFFHFAILSSKKSKVQTVKEKESLTKLFKKYSNALNYFKFSPSDEVVNNILKHADL